MAVGQGDTQSMRKSVKGLHLSSSFSFAVGIPILFNSPTMAIRKKLQKALCRASFYLKHLYQFNIVVSQNI